MTGRLLRRDPTTGPTASIAPAAPEAGADEAATPTTTVPGETVAPPGSGDPRQQVVRLLLVVAAIAAVSVFAGVGKTVLLLVGIFLMIVLHEFGHFVMAKLGGIKVTEFFVGFGTRLWSIRRGETEYGVKVLPLGGYVKIIGMNSIEEVDPADEPRTYRQQSFGRRLSVAVAGSAVHFLIALILLFIVFFSVGDQGYFVSAPAGTPLEVTGVSALTNGPSPAQQVGLRDGDQILSIDGRKLSDISITDYIKSKPEQVLDVLVRRNGQVLHLYPKTVDRSKVEPKVGAGQVAPAPATQPTGFLGVSFGTPPAKFGFFQSFSKAGGAFVSVSAETFDALGGLFSAHGITSYAHILSDKKAADAPGALRFESPVGITRLANQAANDGLESSLFLLIAINIFVGIFNMVPLLPLDGGHVAIAVYEAVRSRKGRRYHADAAKMMPFVYATLAVIGFIAVSALFLDLRDVISVVSAVRF